MDIQPTNPPLAVNAPAVSEFAAEHREIVRAVKAVNATELLGQDRELSFHIDQRTHKLLVRVVCRKTGEVVSQIPAEYVLRLAESIDR